MERRVRDEPLALGECVQKLLDVHMGAQGVPHPREPNLRCHSVPFAFVPVICRRP